MEVIRPCFIGGVIIMCVLFYDRWLQLLNEYGMCLLTDMGKAVDTVNEVCTSIEV